MKGLSNQVEQRELLVTTKPVDESTSTTNTIYLARSIFLFYICL